MREWIKGEGTPRHPGKRLTRREAGAQSFGSPSEGDCRAAEDPKKTGGVEDRVLNESPKNPYHQVVDDSDARNFEAKGYRGRQASEEAFGEDYAVATDEAGPASFEMEVPETRYYSVWARWPTGGGDAEAARIGIPSSDGTKWEGLDQSEDGGMWVGIGAYEMQKGQREILLESGGRAVADAVMIVGDALVGEDGRTGSVADPYDFAADEEDRTPTPSNPSPKARRPRRRADRSARTSCGSPRGTSAPATATIAAPTTCGRTAPARRGSCTGPSAGSCQTRPSVSGGWTRAGRSTRRQTSAAPATWSSTT